MDKSLSEVCYEQIKDQYWYGLFGDFKLIIDRNTGYFNATKLCLQGGKRFDNWFRNKESKALIAYYAKKIHGETTQIPFITVKGGQTDSVQNVLISGTYLPEQLILSISMWISQDFYDKVYVIVKSYFISEFNERYANNMGHLQKRLQQIQHDMDQVKLQNTRYEHENKQLLRQNETFGHENEQLMQQNERFGHENEQLMKQNQRFQHYEEDIAFKTVDVKKLHTFALIQKNCSTGYPLHVVRVQRVSFPKIIKQLSEQYPEMKVILQFGYNPNSINLFNRIKERIENIHVRYNEINLLNGYTAAEFVQDIQSIANTTVHER